MAELRDLMLQKINRKLTLSVSVTKQKFVLISATLFCCLHKPDTFSHLKTLVSY